MTSFSAVVGGGGTFSRIDDLFICPPNIILYLYHLLAIPTLFHTSGYAPRCLWGHEKLFLFQSILKSAIFADFSGEGGGTIPQKYINLPRTYEKLPC